MTKKPKDVRPEPQERLTYTVEEAGEILGLGRGLAYKLARGGELPVIKLGNRLLVPRAALQRLLTV
jgi:excisionase family DNA binding protein